MSLNPRRLTDDHFIIQASEAFQAALSEGGRRIVPGDAVLVAFSGGPDSTALLAWATCFASMNKLDVHACHINHKLRADESEQDEAFCRELCADWNIRFHVERLAERTATGIDLPVSEAELREKRYSILSKIAESNNCRVCVTGHTVDDQVETILFRIFRGTGPFGLLGIPPFRAVSENFSLVRPLLELRRTDCLNLLNKLSLTPRFDSTNQDNIYTRNYLRNALFPLVECRFPGFVERVDNLRKLMEGDEDLLRCLTREALSELRENRSNMNVWNTDEFNELPLSLRRRVIYQHLKDLKIEFDFNRIESLLELIDADGESAISLNEKWELRLSMGEIRWQKRLAKSAPDSSPVQLSVSLHEGSNMVLRLGISIRLEKVDLPIETINFPAKDELQVFANLSRLQGELRLRQREPGDHIQPLGMSTPVRLKKYLHTHKSTETLSFGGRAIVLADEAEVLWVPGCGMSQRIAVSERATHRISINRLAPDSSTIC